MRRALPLMILVAALLCSAAALAHEFRPALLRLVERTPGEFELQLTLPAEVPNSLEPLVPAHCQLSSAPTVLRRLDCGERGLVGELGLAGSEAWDLDVIVEIEWLHGPSQRALLAPGDPPLELGRNEEGVLLDYMAIGVEHILLGFDHLLFVVGLWLIARRPGALLLSVTAFTLAHSLTLVASVLGWVQVPAPPVEAAIALSIVLLARESLAPEHRRDTATWQKPWLVAGLFGTIHGFGFAGALQTLGLAPGSLAPSLAGFNLGVELGQIAVLASLVLLARAARRAGFESDSNRALGWAMGTIGFAWLIDRSLGLWP